MSAMHEFVAHLKQQFGGAAAVAAGPVAVGGPAQAPDLTSIAISPAKPELIGGLVRQFVALGTFSDGSTRPVTTEVVWSAEPASVATVDAKGRVTPQQVTGSAKITARDPHNPGIAATVTASVTPDPMPTISAQDEAKAEILGNMEKALGKTPPDKQALKDLVDAGNAKILDLLVQDLPEPPDNKVIVAAMEARFNITMRDIDDPDDDEGVAEGSKAIKQIYLTMLKVPEDAVRNNPSLKGILREPPKMYHDNPKGNIYAYYGTGSKVAVLPAVRPDFANNPNPFGNTDQLPDVEEAFKPNGNKPPTYLSFATLHEVAHGVDDNKHAMTDGGGNKFAEWEINTLDDVVLAVAGKFKVKPEVVEKLLGVPPEKMPNSDDDLVVWCKAIRHTNNLWDKGSEAKKHAIGDRVYHEAYPAGNPPQWVSYNVNARKKGITGYQFRAPGEWFADLYAAYYSGMLKDKHPYIDWIKKF